MVTKKAESTKSKHITRIELHITGMHCASCVARVENVLKKMPGVLNAQVNLAMQEAVLDLLPDTVNIQNLQQALASAGDYKIQEREDDAASSPLSNHQIYARNLKKKLISGIILSIFIMIASMTHMIPGAPKITGGILNPLLFFLTLPVIFWVGGSFYSAAWKQLRHWNADMNTLVAMGTGTAFLYSTWITWFSGGISGTSEAGPVYFDTASMIITLILLGRFLEARAKYRTSDAIRKLMDLRPKLAHLIQGEVIVDLPVTEIQKGQHLRVKPGESVPADGEIIMGSSSLNESMMTGESLPAEKAEGDRVIGGTLNTTGSFDMIATQVGESTVLARIIRLVREAQGSKAPIQRLADRIAAVFVPIVILFAALTFFAWMFLSPGSGIVQAMMRFIAVLIIACPCAMGLATPTAIIVGTGIGAEHGILIKGGAVLESLNDVDTFVFDKTGTLTQGKPAVSQMVTIHGITEERLLVLAASAEQHSEHPLADAVIQAARSRSLNIEPVTRFKAHPGFGIEARLGNHILIAGTQQLIEQFNIPLDLFRDTLTHWSHLDYSIMIVALDKQVQGLIAITDPVRSEAVKVIRKLKQSGHTTVLLSGDRNAVAQQIGRQTGVDRIYSEILPDKKAEIIHKLREEGRKVAMIGDGINDTPALAVADISLAMGGGTDQALETADITLMNNNLWSVFHAVKLSEKTLRTIRQNLFWAFIYNIIGIPIAAGVLYPFWGILLKPVFAAAAMSLSSVSVVTNALRLKSTSEAIFKK